MRTPEEIEAEIDRTRDRMDATLTELEFRLTPRELIRDGINSLSGLQASRYVGKYAGKMMHLGRRYPKPAAIAGLADMEEMHRAWGQCHHVTIMPKVVPTLARKGRKR